MSENNTNDTTVVRLDINEILDELRHENNRLSNQLQFANQSLIMFEKYRNYLTKFYSNCKCFENKELSKQFSSLENEYQNMIKQMPNNLNDTNHTIGNNDNDIDIDIDMHTHMDTDVVANRNQNQVKIISVNNNNYRKNNAINSSVMDVNMNVNVDHNDNSSVSRINFIRNQRNTHKKVIDFKFVKPNKKRKITNECNIELKNILAINNCVNDYSDNSEYVVSDQFSDYMTQTHTHTQSNSLSQYNLITTQPHLINIIDHNINDQQQQQQQQQYDINYDINSLKAIEFHDANGCRRFRCPYPNCNVDYAGVHRVRSHMFSVHTNHRPFKCSQCNKGFTRSDYLGEHMNSVHSTAIYSCDWNGCTFETKNYKRLNKHKLSHTGNELFRCDAHECTKRYYSKNALERHMNFAHKPFAPKLFDCDWPECGLSFSSQNELKCHTRGRHVVRELRVCEWPGCESTFKTTSALNVHVSSRHTGEKPFKCDWPGCEFAFINRSAMRKHITVHSEQKNFMCNWPECGKKFRTSYSLKIHTRVHCGERPFKCEWPQCGRSYTVKSKLVRHYKTHSNVNLI